VVATTGVAACAVDALDMSVVSVVVEPEVVEVVVV
jgi:hypothetical protein